MAREDIAGRIKQVREKTGLSQRALADKIGIAYRTWQDIEGGKNVPSGETLLKISELGFDPGWVLTGAGQMLLGDKNPAPMIDPFLLEKLAKLASAVYRDSGIKLPGERATVEAAALYNDLVTKVSDMTDADEIEATLPQLRHQLKKRLSEAVAEPGAGKRSA